MTIDSLRAVYDRTRMVGWDFSRLEGRLTATEPPWDVEAGCLAAVRSASRSVDLGTGGGERLGTLLAETAGHGGVVTATEGWEPNLPVARSNLAPWGIQVLPYDADTRETMPFEDGSVDLVMSRHEAIDAGEVARVLAPGGRLLTQQVDGFDAPEIHEWFGEEFLYPHVTLGRYITELEEAGLRIDVADAWDGVMEFTDVEALVMYLAMVPWDAPNFSVDMHADQLTVLGEHMPLRVTQRRFRLYATKA